MNTQILTWAIALLLALPGTTRAEGDSKAAEVVAAARKAIGDKKLDALKTLTLEAQIQRNVGAMQMTTDTEILLDLPNRYLRSDTGGGPVSGGFTSGFNGDTVIRPANAMSMAGGAMIIRMGPGPGPGPGGPMPDEKPSPEEQARLDQMLLRSTRIDVSRLMLGWFVATHPALNVEFTYAGEAESPDGKADVIDAKNTDGFNARLFVDRATHLPLMVTYQGPQPRMVTIGGPPRQLQQPASGGRAGAQPAPERNDMTEDERKKMRDDAEKQLEASRTQPQPMVEFTLFFDDWQESGGIKFPHKLRRAMGGTTDEEWTVTRVKVNPKIDPKNFEG